MSPVQSVPFWIPVRFEGATSCWQGTAEAAVPSSPAQHKDISGARGLAGGRFFQA